MFNAQRNKRHSALKFQEDMKSLWAENSESVVQLINHAVFEAPTAIKWGTTLANNQQRIANGIVYFCGEKERVSRLFNDLLQFIGEAIDVFVWKKNAGKLRERWFTKADELANILDSLSNWNIRGYLYKQILLIESIIKVVAKRDVGAVKFYRQELLNNNNSLSITLTNGIIKDNNKVFI